MIEPMGPEPHGRRTGADQGDADLRNAIDEVLGPAPRVVNWRTLDADQAEKEWYALDAFVEFLRRDWAPPPQVIPPLWHRHWSLVWELSALHVAWDAAHDRQAAPTAALDWDQKWELAKTRLRGLVAESGTRVDRDRPTRLYPWPGEDSVPEVVETPITDRRKDFDDFVRADVARRAAGL